MPSTVQPTSMWTATHGTIKPLPVELEIDEFTKDDLQKIFNAKPNKEQIERYMKQCWPYRWIK